MSMYKVINAQVAMYDSDSDTASQMGDLRRYSVDIVEIPDDNDEGCYKLRVLVDDELSEEIYLEYSETEFAEIDTNNVDQIGKKLAALYIGVMLCAKVRCH
jgi:hypothetical protein